MYWVIVENNEIECFFDEMTILHVPDEMVERVREFDGAYKMVEVSEENMAYTCRSQFFGFEFSDFELAGRTKEEAGMTEDDDYFYSVVEVV